MANNNINNPLNPVQTATVAPTAPSVPVASNNVVTQSAMNNTNAMNGVNNQYGTGFTSPSSVQSNYGAGYNTDRNVVQGSQVDFSPEQLAIINQIKQSNQSSSNPFFSDLKTIGSGIANIGSDFINTVGKTGYYGLGYIGRDGLINGPVNFIKDIAAQEQARPKLAGANAGNLITQPQIAVQPKGAIAQAAEKFTYNPVNIDSTNPALIQNQPNTNFDIANVLKQIYGAQNFVGRTDLTNTGNLFNALQGQNSNQADNLEAQRQQLLAKLGQGESNLNNFLNNYKNAGSLSDLLASKFQIANQSSNNKILESLLGNILQNSIQNNQNATNRINESALGYQNSADEKDAAFKQSLASILPQTQARANLDQLSNNLAISQNRDKVATSPNDQAISFLLNAKKSVLDLNNRLSTLDEKDPKQAFEAEQIRNQLNNLGQITGTSTTIGKPQIEKINTYDPVTGQVNGQKLVQINQKKVNGQFVPDVVDLQSNNGPSISDLVAKLQANGASKESIEKAKAIADKNSKK